MWSVPTTPRELFSGLGGCFVGIWKARCDGGGKGVPTELHIAILVRVKAFGTHERSPKLGRPS